MEIYESILFNITYLMSMKSEILRVIKCDYNRYVEHDVIICSVVRELMRWGNDTPV